MTGQDEVKDVSHIETVGDDVAYHGRLRPAVTLVLLLLVLGVARLVLKGNVHDLTLSGALFGTLFGHTALASLVAALAPAPLIFRWPISLFWISVLWVAAVLHDATQRVLALDGTVGVALAMLMSWGLGQLVFVFLHSRCGYRLRHATQRAGTSAERQDRQFSIKHLLILMALVAIYASVVRTASSAWVSEISTGEILVTALLMATVGVVALLVLASVVVAAWIRPMPVWTKHVLLWVVPLITIAQRGLLGFSFWELVLTYLCVLAWSAGFVLVAQVHGYRLTSDSR